MSETKIKLIRILSFTTLSTILMFGLNKFSPVTKQEMIEIAKTHHCPLRLHFSYGDDISYYEGCISILKDDFSKLSNSDKKDIVVNFIIYGGLDAGASVAFIESIGPNAKTIFKDLDNITNTELQEKFMASKSQLIDYHKGVNHYKNSIHSPL
jgi:hypothetical protein